MRKRILALTAAAILLTSCALADKPDETSETTAERETGVSIFTLNPPETAENTTSVSFETLPETVSETAAETFYEEIIEAPDWEYLEYSELYECENGLISGEGEILQDGEDYSGSGTVDINGGSGLSLIINIPSPQHYNITLRFSSDSPSEWVMRCDEAPFERRAESIGSGDYETLKFSNIYIPAGEISLYFGGFSAPCRLDCVLIESSHEINDLNYNLDNSDLANRSASDAAKNLYSYLCSQYGRKTLSAQECSQGSNAEIDAVYRAIGRYPAIRFGEIAPRGSENAEKETEIAIDWAKSGGIVGYSWYWEMGGSLYAGNGFDLSAAATDLDIAAMDGGALSERYNSGDISAETLMIIDGIDAAADQLKRLRDENIPVIFRPLPEAGSGVFWWGSDTQSYLWLYKLIFERMSLYHGLDNLIWVFNGQSADYYPGDGFADIISLDIYYPEGEKPDGSGINFLLSAANFGNKPVAISECSVLPEPADMARDRCRWLFCSVFSGEYAILNGELSEKNMPLGRWNDFYYSADVITRDEIEYNQ